MQVKILDFLNFDDTLVAQDALGVRPYKLQLLRYGEQWHHVLAAEEAAHPRQRDENFAAQCHFYGW